VPSLTAAKPGIFSRKPSFLPSLHSSPNLSVSNHLILPDSQLCNPVLFPICEFPAAQLINYNHSFFPKLFSPEYSVFIIFYFSGRFNVLQKTYFFITFTNLENLLHTPCLTALMAMPCLSNLQNSQFYTTSLRRTELSVLCHVSQIYRTLSSTPCHLDQQNSQFNAISHNSTDLSFLPCLSAL